MKEDASMVAYVLSDDSGAIVQSGVARRDHLDLQVRPGITLSEGVGTSDTHYVVNGVITPYTPEETIRKSSLPRGYVWNAQARQALDQRTLQQAKDAAWDKIKVSRDAALTQPFQCNGHTYDTNVENISGAVQMALLSQLGNQPFSMQWTLADNSVITLDGPGMIQVGQALGQHVNTIYSTARSIRDQIDSASTNSSADAVTWTP